MSIITLPDNNFRSINWTLVQPTQVNRSEFTSARQVMQLPGASYWKASAEHAPIRGEANIRTWRSFFAQLKGQANTFRLPSTEAAQRSGTNPRIKVPTITLTPTAGMSMLATDSAKKVTGTGTAETFYATTPKYSSGVSLSYIATQAAVARMVGMNSTPGDGTDHTRLEIGFGTLNGSGYQTIINGTASGVLGTYSAGDVFSIGYYRNKASFFLNGRQVSQSIATSGLSLGIDSSFLTLNAQADSIRFGLLGAGVTSLDLEALPASQTALSAGSFVTVPLVNGGEQMVVLTADLVADSGGLGTMTFLPALRFPAVAGAPVETKNPYCIVALDSPEVSYSVDPGALYTFGLSATEAF